MHQHWADTTQLTCRIYRQLTQLALKRGKTDYEAKA